MQRRRGTLTDIRLADNNMKVIEDMGKVGKRGLRVHEDKPPMLNDLDKLQFQLAVFNKDDNNIYKLSCLDMRGLRFDCSGATKTIYVRFPDGILFNFSNDTELDIYYDLYLKNTTDKKIKKREDFYDFLSKSQ